MNSKEKTLLICDFLSQKKAKGIVYIEVEHKTSLCDYFVVAGGSSKTQVKALAENLEEKLKKICSRILSLSIDGIGEDQHISASIGGVIGPDIPEELLKKADEMLSMAKKNRGTVEIWN